MAIVSTSPQAAPGFGGASSAAEESALLEVVEGKPAWPRLKGVIPVHFGLYGHPTLVNNVETLCHVTHIFRNGAAWFKAIGTADTPGTTCITLSGDVKKPGVYEVHVGYEAELMPSDFDPARQLAFGWHSHLARTRRAVAEARIEVR